MNQDLQQQFVRDMLTESYEGLDRYDQAILHLEQGSVSAEVLHDIFRVVHSLKGTAGCLGFARIQRVAHAGENLLDQLRNGELSPSPEIAAGLLQLSDALRELLKAIDKTGQETDVDHAALIEYLNTLRAGPGVAPPAPLPPPAAEPPPEATADSPSAWGLFDEPAADPSPPPAATPLPVAPPPPPAKAPAADTAPAPAATTSVRVDVTLLDKLMNLVGELVLARNQLLQAAQARPARPAAVTEVSQRLNLITTELQEGVMKTRMQPIGSIWSKFPRIVRDIAHALGRQVRLETFGATTELDRTIIEAIRDPLTHIIRNAIDHGIELPAQRIAAGKPAEGTIVMRAYHEGGQVNIEISDDGGGIDVARVRRKAVERGMLTAEAAERLSDREAINLIFLPGFSTAEKVTNVSGRGVGMDVVKTNIEKIGGAVDIHSILSTGTTLKIKIPLTLAIIPALVVRSGGQRFAIPQACLLELVRLEGAAAESALENVYGAPVFRLRGRLLPLVFLHRELKLAAPVPTETLVVNIVVLQADHRSFGLVVEEVCDTEEIVVKPLSQQLRRLPMYAGATIMGDGRVALILDAMGLAQHARVLGEERPSTLTTAPHAESLNGKRQQLLLFSVGRRERLAVPLGAAARLEEFPRDQVERAGNREVIQYRGRILPLISLHRHLHSTGDAEPGTEELQVVVYTEHDRSVGLVVSRIDDIVEDVFELEHKSGEPGILGSAIVQGKVTDLLDLQHIVRAAEPAFFAA